MLRKCVRTYDYYLVLLLVVHTRLNTPHANVLECLQCHNSGRCWRIDDVRTQRRNMIFSQFNPTSSSLLRQCGMQIIMLFCVAITQHASVRSFSERWCVLNKKCKVFVVCGFTLFHERGHHLHAPCVHLCGMDILNNKFALHVGFRYNPDTTQQQLISPSN